ncbi:MAG: serine hydrolase [Alphaproteobacteria bacterium]|nr:serine hydrolase [Alphaproteobacteria bacterium]
MLVVLASPACSTWLRCGERSVQQGDRGVSRRGALTFALAASVCACGQARAQEAVAGSRQDIAELLAGRIDAQHRGTGGLVSVVQARDAWTVRHGTVSRESASGVSLDTPFQIASLTKIFTALLLSDAAMRGEVALDDSLAAYLDVSVPSFEGRAIVLADLATHASGLPLRPPSRVDRSRDNPYAGYSDADLRADIAATTLSRAPGSAFEYSNYGFALLGAALSARLGKPYETILRERILTPLRMRATSLTPSTATRARLIQGYDMEFVPANVWDFGALAPAGGLFSTARDLRKFLALWTEPFNTPLAQAARDMFTTRRSGPDAQTQMALGWRVIERNGRTLGWSNGSGGGVRAYMAVAPGAEGVIAYANMQTGIGVDDIGLRVLDPSNSVDVSPIPLRVAIPLPASVLDRYTGTYAYAPDDLMTITREGDGLVLVSGPNRLSLFAESETLFFIREENVTVTFDAGASTFVFRQAGQEYLYRRTQ